METIFRVIFWSLCLTGYSKLVLSKKRNTDFVIKQEIAFCTVTAYALLIVVRSVSFRFAQTAGLRQIGQELLTAVGMLAAYTVIRMAVSFWLKEKYLKWIYYLVSGVLLVNLCVYVLLGTVTREVYFVIYVIAFVVSLVWAQFCADRIEISDNHVWKGRLKFSLPVSLFTGFSLYLYLPSELYMGNPQAFMVEYLTFIIPLVVAFIVFVASYLVITLCFVTTKHYYVCNNFCLTFTLLSNIQNMLLNGTMQSMDGTKQQWSAGVIVVNAILWLGTFIGVFAASHFIKKKIRNVFKVVGYCGTAIQVVSLVVLLVITLPAIEFDNYVLSTEKVFEVAPKDNVFVFVLDWFDNQIIEQILAEDEEFLEPLDGFVHYANTTGKYAFTDMSVPYMLTGVEWEYGQSEADYAKSAQEKSYVLETIADAGYTIGLYTESVYIGAGEQPLVENGRQAKRSLDINSELRLMAKTARYKTYPFLFKHCFFYSDDDIWDMRRSDVETHNIYNDIPFAFRLLSEGVTVDENRNGAFKFYHLHGAHTSYLMNEEFESEDTDMLTQSRASLKIVYEFINQLKATGVYEDATIIITADHGQNYFDRPSWAEELGLELISSPILFVKEAGSYGSKMTVSGAPVSHEELVPTVLEAVVGNTGGLGRTFEEIEENESRERVFIYGRSGDIPFVKYTINGDVMNPENWSEPVALPEE